MKHTQLSDGVTVKTFALPPEHFDITKADDTSLLRHGFPVAGNDEQRARIAKAFERVAARLKVLEPQFEVLPPKPHTVIRFKGKGDFVESDLLVNWAGAIVNAPAGQNFSYVSCEFTVPNVAESFNGGPQEENSLFPSYSSHWIGLDDDTTGQVCQAGVECDSIPKKVLAKPYVWVEWYPGPLIKVTNLSVSPGDLLGILICTQGKGSTSATASFTNFTIGETTSFQFNAPPGITLVGASAEWVSERPGNPDAAVQPGFWPLGNFGSVVFCQCVAGASSLTVQPEELNIVEMTRSETDETLICEAISPTAGMVRTMWESQA